MRRFLAAVLFAATLSAFCAVGTRSVAAAECYPYCDFNHYYGPSDFTYVRPGLYGYPVCNARGACSPQLVYSANGIRRGRITVRLPRSPAQRSFQ
jgi:hypothetical protein